MSTRPRKKRFTLHQRQEYVAEFTRSGMSQAEFCRRAKLPAMTFSRWRRKLTVTSPVFAEVEVSAPVPAVGGTAPVLGGAAVLHLPNGATLEVALSGGSAWAGLGLMLKTLEA